MMISYLLLLFASYSMLNHHLTPLVCSNLESVNLLGAGSQVLDADVCWAAPLGNIPSGEKPSWERDAKDTLASYHSILKSICHNSGLCSSASRNQTETLLPTTIPNKVGTDENLWFDDDGFIHTALYGADVNDSRSIPLSFSRPLVFKDSKMHNALGVCSKYRVRSPENSVDSYKDLEFSALEVDACSLEEMDFLSEVNNLTVYEAFSAATGSLWAGRELKWSDKVPDVNNNFDEHVRFVPISYVPGPGSHSGSRHSHWPLRCRSWLYLPLAVCTLSAAFAGFLWLCRRTRRGREGQPNEWLGRAAIVPRRYLYREVAAATSNFAESERIGRGGSGAVYRGFLGNVERIPVAVKVLSPDLAAQGRREFEAEVRIISRLRHRNLVHLFGWCNSRRGLMLIYELVPEGSLDNHLHGPNRFLDWIQRYRIALDLGSAILYLHTECEQCVLHGDIKPSNVMLDSSLRAKLGDFGLARLVDHGAEPQTTQVVAGTVGFIDPEFVATRRPSVESDVYSFGVVLLEIASGKRPTAASGQPAGDDAPALLRCVRDMYNRNSILDAADQRLNGQFDRQQMERVLVTGLWCVHRDRARRPSIAQAMAALRPEGEGAGLPDFPSELLVDLEQIHGGLQEQAFGDLSFGSTHSSAATAYHTPMD